MIILKESDKVSTILFLKSYVTTARHFCKYPDIQLFPTETTTKPYIHI